MKAAEHTRRLRDHARYRRHGLAIVSVSTDRLRRAVKDAWEDGVSVARIAHATGVSRQTIYAWTATDAPEATEEGST